jgi:hypothetical protein
VRSVQTIRIDLREAFQRRKVLLLSSCLRLWTNSSITSVSESILTRSRMTDIARALGAKADSNWRLPDHRPTEALTTVDVNTGGLSARNLTTRSLKPTEASQAIARQPRLRNLGGTAIVDFIDMIMKTTGMLCSKSLKQLARPSKPL